MNSMHVKAFFEYLMDITNDYWTKIPTDSNPTSQPIRDGVALEDDMALRALFPHIRPKRGRKRPVDDDTATSLSPAPSQAQTQAQTQRSHLAPSSAVDGVSGPMSADPSRLTGAPWTPSDVQQTPLFRWPQSAITPTSRNSFWDDALEPQSAVTPSKPKLAAQRRGPKNVSSAWRPGVANGGVKPRGRPPMHRTPVDISLPPFTAGLTSAATTTTTTDQAESEPVAPIYTPPVSTAPKTDGGPSDDSISIPSITSQPHPPPVLPRPTRPSISLTVPERPSGSVRLATPPPVVVINGEPSEAEALPHPAHSGIPPSHFSLVAQEATAASQKQAQNEGTMSYPKDVPRFYFERIEDRTNVDEVLAYMIRSCLAANFLDAEDNPGTPCTTNEALAITNCTLEDMYNNAESPQTFLINLAAVAGGGYLVTEPSRIKRLGVADGMMKYGCAWTYGFGPFRGTYHMELSVPAELIEESDACPDSMSGESEAKLSANEWKTKYENLLMTMNKKDKKFTDLSTKVTDLLKLPPRR